METVSASQPDGIHLPGDAQPESLWSCLHDADLQAICSDRLGRSAVLEFQVRYLLNHHHLPQDLLFQFCFAGVRSVRALTHELWTGPLPDTSGKSREEERRLIHEYHAKGRETSVDWARFETSVSADEPFLIYDAALASDAGAVAVRLEGNWDDIWHTVFVQAQSLEVRRSDGQPFSRAELQRLGEAYWEAFGRRV